MNKREVKGGFLQIIFLIIFATSLLFYFEDEVRPYIFEYVIEPSQAFWEKAKEFMTGKTFDGLREKGAERSTIDE